MKTQTFKLGLIPCNQVWEQPTDNLEHLQTLLSKAEHAHLWLIPEMFTTGFTMAPTGLALNETTNGIEFLSKLAEIHNTHIAGSFIWKDQERYFNRFLLINSNGIQGTYDKKNLFSLGGEKASYTPGTEQQLWSVNGVKIKPFICYDLRFPEWCRNSESADLMIFTANWPKTRDLHWRSLITARAIENQTYVAGVNRLGTDGNSLVYSGLSLIADANGSIITEKLNSEEPVVTCLDFEEQRRYREKFPFLSERNKSLIIPT